MSAPIFTPIQVVLDVRTYQDARVRTGFPSHTDFFEDRNEEFRRHKEEITNSLHSAARALSRKGDPIGYLKVSMRNEALAKSHRPKTLFPSRAASVVGIEDIGELLIQVNEGVLRRAAEQVARAEIEVATVTRIDKKTLEPVEVLAPSANRAETGAIEKISLWSAADKRSFPAQRALRWAQEQKIGLRYRIDLFDLKIPEDRTTRNEIRNFQARDQFLKDLAQRLGGGYLAISHKPSIHSNERLYLWLVKDRNVQTITTLKQAREIIPLPTECDLEIGRHEVLLKLLDESPLVRRISLPSALRSSHSLPSTPKAGSTGHIYQQPELEAEYPTIGIIDGGISHIPQEWIRYSTTPISPQHRDLSHGTEIGSLLVGGQQLNNPAICPEPDGCFLADLAMIPLENYFGEYYAGGDIDFLQQLEVEVRKAKEATGARIFCFSLNVLEEINGKYYDELSLGLDNIAIRNDIIFVISAGNLPAGGYRAEWHTSSSIVLGSYASTRNDRIVAPADSIFNLSIAALNPNALAGPHSGAPARYSRRGPGYKFTVKPDLAHFGGSGPANAGDSTGMIAVDHNGKTNWIHGTSYSAPIAAKALARLNHLTKGALTREALIALAIHGSTCPDKLKHKDFEHLKRDLVGFGVPPIAEELINGTPTSSTLVFSDILQPKKDLFFKFSWPQCLATEGKCRGNARVTIVYSPPIADKYGPEMIRINLDVCLQQYQPKQQNYKKKTNSVFNSADESAHLYENDLLKDGLKWNNVKQEVFRSPKGVGESSDWQLKVNYLEREDQVFPEEGVPFTVILTIYDPKEEAPVYQDMRTSLTASNVKLDDIRVAHQARVDYDRT